MEREARENEDGGDRGLLVVWMFSVDGAEPTGGPSKTGRCSALF